MSATLLALDLSTAHGSIAVVRGDDVLFQSSFQSERSHNAQVFAPLREALAAAGEGLTGIVIGNGPGSYTGVRIAIAAAQRHKVRWLLLGAIPGAVLAFGGLVWLRRRK